MMFHKVKKTKFKGMGYIPFVHPVARGFNHMSIIKDSDGLKCAWRTSLPHYPAPCSYQRLNKISPTFWVDQLLEDQLDHKETDNKILKMDLK